MSKKTIQEQIDDIPNQVRIVTNGDTYRLQRLAPNVWGFNTKWRFLMERSLAPEGTIYSADTIEQARVDRELYIERAQDELRAKLPFSQVE